MKFQRCSQAGSPDTADGQLGSVKPRTGERRAADAMPHCPLHRLSSRSSRALGAGSREPGAGSREPTARVPKPEPHARASGSRGHNRQLDPPPSPLMPCNQCQCTASGMGSVSSRPWRPDASPAAAGTPAAGGCRAGSQPSSRGEQLRHQPKPRHPQAGPACPGQRVTNWAAICEAPP
jgi:hypothetical protein